jgi:hypothetical protein
MTVNLDKVRHKMQARKRFLRYFNSCGLKEVGTQEVGGASGFSDSVGNTLENGDFDGKGGRRYGSS